MTTSRTLLYYDSEFTGLHQYSTLISLALVSDDEVAFYAEFSDYDSQQCDAWIQQHVLSHTQWLGRQSTPLLHTRDKLTECYGDSAWVSNQLSVWLQQFSAVEIWADCLAFDWVLFCQLFGGALQLPKQVFYMPFDFSTLLKLRGINPDISRSELAGFSNPMPHHALADAMQLKTCFQKLCSG